MDIVADRIDHVANRLRGQLRAVAAIASTGEKQLGTMEVEAGRPALVHLDMRLAVADHAAMRRAHRRQRKAIGRRTRGDPQDGGFAPEQLGKSCVEPLRQRIAVIGRIGPIGGAQRLPHLGVYACGIVGHETHWNAPTQPGV